MSLGAPLLQEHKDRLNADLPHRFYELYGCTEGFVTILDRDEAERKSGSVGRPTQYFEMRIVDAAGRDLPPREIGEIAGRGPIMMQGYYNRPDLTEQAIRDGWIFSGDWINERAAARYQRVSEVVIMSEFPRSAAGKTLKREMREPYWATRDRKI